MTGLCDCHGLPLILHNRCRVTGHRAVVNGRKPIETRYFPPRVWLAELRLRRLARKAATT